MTTLVGGCQLDIDPAVQQDAEIARAITGGMAYLAERPGFCSADLTASWRYSDAHADQLVFELSETDGETRLAGRRHIPVPHMHKPVLRDIWVSRVWGDFLSQRIDRNQLRIRQLVDQLSEEEVDA